MSRPRGADTAGLSVTRLSPDRASEAVAVLCDAFGSYPVMRYLIGERPGDYPACLERLIGIFVSARTYWGDPILAIEEEGRPVAIATITPPGERPQVPSIEDAREALWRD